VVAIAFEEKQQLAIRNPLDSRGASPKRQLQIPLPQIIGFAHMPVNIDNPDGIL
jgi:hypothetical protein